MTCLSAVRGRLGRRPSICSRAVVGHDADDGDPKAGVVVNRRFEEGDSAFLALVGQDLGEGDARCVVDRDMNEPRGAATCPAADRR